jgi:hypothetical protein
MKPIFELNQIDKIVAFINIIYPFRSVVQLVYLLNFDPDL